MATGTISFLSKTVRPRAVPVPADWDWPPMLKGDPSNPITPRDKSDMIAESQRVVRRGPEPAMESDIDEAIPEEESDIDEPIPEEESDIDEPIPEEEYQKRKAKAKARRAMGFGDLKLHQKINMGTKWKKQRVKKIRKPSNKQKKKAVMSQKKGRDFDLTISPESILY